MTTYRQGDVLIEAIGRLPRDLKPLARDNGRVVLAYGEITGHAHAIADVQAEGLAHERVTEVEFLRVLAEAGVELRHEEHATITLPKGDYRIKRQREYTPFGERRVAD